MSDKMKKILILTSKEGHLSMAQAAHQALEKASFEVQIVNFISPKNYDKIHISFYRYFPFLFKVPYKIGKKDTVQKAVKIFVEKKFKKDIKNEIKNEQPDLIISTNLFYNPAITKVLDYQKTPIPFINIVTDPWVIHPLVFSSSADLNLVYDEKGIKIGRKNKIALEKMLALGWLVRKDFYQKYNLTKIRKKLGLKKNIFTLLICGGSEGSNMILKIIPALLTIKKPLQVIIVCGTNRTLYKALYSFKKIIPKLTKVNRLENISQRLNLKLFRFTDQLPQLMNVSDLVMGKAGPNLIFEAVATKRPFFAICHMSGQEDGNLNLIRKKWLGFVEERPVRATKLLEKIINNPKMLAKFSTSIKKKRQQNLQAERKLIQAVRSLTHPPEFKEHKDKINNK